MKRESIAEDIGNIAKEHKHVAILFSGGKDSTALTFGLLNAFIRNKHKPEKVWIIYANTLVEPPPLLRVAQKSLQIFKELGTQIGIPVIPKMLIPPIKDRFWVLLIGKGYPPPSVRFRWCSERLKIRPVKRFLKYVKETEGKFPLVLSGVRLNEGDNRKNNLSKRLLNGKWMKYEGLRECLVYAPLLNWSSNEVWKYIGYNEAKWQVSMGHLKDLYSVTFDKANSFRTGCWVCTLIRRDQSLEKLASRDLDLIPLIKFRKFLQEIRDSKELREKVEKNGRSYLGPLNMETRRKILGALEEIYELPPEERKVIYEIWRS